MNRSLFPIVFSLFCLTAVLVTPGCRKDPKAIFSFIGDGCHAPCNVQFNNLSTEALTYLWDFDDGETSVDFSPTHRFINGGTYDVTLTATGRDGASLDLQQVYILDPYLQVTITTFTINVFKFQTDAGDEWDQSEPPADRPPDVLIELNDNDGTTICTFGPFPNLAPADLPFEFDASACVITEFEGPFNMEFYDEDATSNDLIGNITFDIQNYNGSDPGTATLINTDGDINVSLNLDWE